MSARGERTLLTYAQQKIVRDAIREGHSQAEAAWLAGISLRLLQTRMLDQLTDVRSGRGRRGTKRLPIVDPTPEEIEKLKAEIRASNGRPF